MDAPHPDELLAVAHVTRPHGVRGELSAIPLAPPPIDLAALLVGRIWLRDARGIVREVRGTAARPHQDRWLVTLEGVETMEAAGALREMDLCLPRAELPELPEGWYWEEDLLGCRVLDRRLGEIGRVRGLDTTLAQPRLRIERPGGATASVPWVSALVVGVDLASREVQTDLPDGYPEISDE
jgi:16S rRNA processing protein RimM